MGRLIGGLRFENIYIRSVLRRAIAKALDEVGAGLVLDVGCGRKQYADLVASVAKRHIGVDHPGTQHGLEAVDVFAVAERLPFADETVDTILCTEVLEHLELPLDAVCEGFRVLRPGGAVILTCPFIWHLHEEPRDFFRYSRFGLRWLVESAGLQVETVRPLNRFWTTFGQLLAYKLNSYNRGPVRFIPVIPLLVIVLQSLLFVLNAFPGQDRWPSHHLVIARKPQQDHR